MRKISDRRARERRKARNIYFKDRADQAFVNRWPRERLLDFRPCLYTGLSRYYRLRKKIRDNARRARPIHAIEAIERPLSNFQKVRRGEQPDCYEWQEEYYTDIVSFWMYWLREVNHVVSFGRAFTKFGEPVYELRRLLEDLLEGRTTQLTEMFPIKAARKGRGRREDAKPVIRHKLTLAICYRILTVVCLRNQKNAVWKLNSILSRLYYERKLRRKEDVLTSPVPDYARKFLSPKDIEKSGIIPRYFIIDNLIRDFMLTFYDQFKCDHLDTETVEAVFKSLYHREAAWSEKEWAEQLAAIRKDIISFGDTSLKWMLFKAWLRAENVTCAVMIRLMSDRDEVRRFGLSM